MSAEDFVEMWVCPRGDAAYAIQRGALADGYAEMAARQAAAAEAEHRERHPEHFG